MDKVFGKAGKKMNTETNAKEGFKNFIKDNAPSITDRLLNGQFPQMIGSSCIDSGNPLEKMFGFEFGETMGLRKIGGLFVPYDENDMSSVYMKSELSLPIKHQKVVDSFFTVHTKCAAAKAIALQLEIPDVTDWLKHVGKNIRRDAMIRNNLTEDADEDILIRAVEEQGAIHNYHALMSYPAIQEAIEENRFILRSCLYDMEAGEILQYNPKTDDFDLLFDSIPTPENDHCCSSDINSNDPD